MERKNFYGRGNDAFVCERCATEVSPLLNGSYRNHCPVCLYSKHVDIIPGDRLAKCRGLMQPINIEHHSKKGFMIVHECIECGFLGRNSQGNDDNFEKICLLSHK
jgi:hypothetical protein